MTNIKDMTHGQLRALISEISKNEKIAEALKSVDVTKIAKSGQSKADLLISHMTDRGMLERAQLIKKLYPELDVDSPNTAEYRAASRNLSSVLNAIKKQVGDRLYSYKDSIALLSEEELKKLSELHRNFGRKTVVVRKKQ